MAIEYLARPWPLVGRDHEIGTLRRLLRRSLPLGVLLTGEAGVGKSRLLAEFADLAAAEGRAVEWVSGAASGSAVPMGAMGQLVRDPPVDEMDPGRFMIACREQLVERYRGRQLFVAVDDVPAMDPESVAFLAQLAVMGCAFVAFTARTEDPLPGLLASLSKDRVVEEVLVVPLSEAAMERLIREVLSGDVGASVVGPLVQLADGNPLFLRELIAEGIESGLLHSIANRWELDQRPGVSPDLRRLVADRLGRLSIEERTGLEALAVAAPADFALAVELCDSSVLQALERRGVLRIIVDGRRRLVEFQHPVYAEAVLAEMPTTRRIEIARSLIDAIVAVGLARWDDPLRLARWHLESGRPVDTETLVTAGWRATLAGDHDLAARIADAAIASGGGDEAMLIRAGAIAQLGCAKEADVLLEKVAIEAEDQLLRARAIDRRAEIAGWLDSEIERAIDLLESGLGGIGDRRARALLESSLLVLRTFARPEPSKALVAAVEIGDDEEAPPAARLQAITLAQLIAVWLGRLPLVFTLAHRGDRLLDMAGLLLREAKARLGVVKGIAWTYDGHLDMAVVSLDEGYRRGLRPPSDGYLGSWGIHLGVALTAGGRLSDAVSVTQEALRLTPYGDIPNHLGNHAALATVVAGEAGDQAALRKAIRVLDSVDYLPPPALAWRPMARAWVAWLNQDVEAAARFAAESAEGALSDENLMCAAMVCDHSLQFGQPRLVVDRLQEIAAATESIVFDTWARHAVALDEGDAAQLSMIAAEYQDRHEYLHALQTSVQTAKLYESRGEDRLAVQALARARYVAGLTGQLDAWLPPYRPSDLTSRETQVATLAAEGHTSRDIADRLFISVRTVDNHLASIYTKLGIHHRSDLASVFDPNP